MSHDNLSQECHQYHLIPQCLLVLPLNTFDYDSQEQYFFCHDAIVDEIENLIQKSKSEAHEGTLHLMYLIHYGTNEKRKYIWNWAL